MLKTTSLKKKPLHLAMLACLSVATLSSISMSANATTDPVVFSFSTIGDTRQDPVTTKQDATTKLANGLILPQDQQWLQNTKAWSRVLRTVQSQKANMLFVNGDMIMGYGRAAVPPSWSTTGPAAISDVIKSDLVNFYTQYAYWRGMVANSFETGTYVLPVPGNHEVQCTSANLSSLPALSQSVCASGKHAYAENENAWRANMGDLISDIANNGRFSSVVGSVASNVSGLTSITAPTSTTDPVVAPAGGINTDQSSLSYSFDITTSAGKLHFAVINTDAVGFDGHAPIGWLTNDFANAKAGGAVKFFVFGHKPAFTYDYLGNGVGNGIFDNSVPPKLITPQVGVAGLDADINARDAFWSLIAVNNATYFSGHEHTTKVDQHPAATGPWQVLVGSGGSPFDPKATDAMISPSTDRAYAWATVRVHQSGAVSLDLYSFSNTFGPTSVIQSIPNLQ